VIAVTMALAMITGKPLLGEPVWRTGSVVIVTYEDDVLEWHRRFAAACIHHALDYRHLLTNIHFLHKPKGKVTFGVQMDGVFASDAAEIIAHLKGVNAAPLIVDPFNHAHDLDDGNINVAIARVAGEMTRIAHEGQAAVLVLHHLRKGATGNPDDLMDATSLSATFRTRRILVRMTETGVGSMNIEDA
jgi:RecA-family ATPase